MKPKLKAPGTKRLKLTYDNLLSNFAFKFSLRPILRPRPPLTWVTPTSTRTRPRTR